MIKQIISGLKVQYIVNLGSFQSFWYIHALHRIEQNSRQKWNIQDKYAGSSSTGKRRRRGRQVVKVCPLNTSTKIFRWQGTYHMIAGHGLECRITFSWNFIRPASIILLKRYKNRPNQLVIIILVLSCKEDDIFYCFCTWKGSLKFPHEVTWNLSLTPYVMVLNVISFDVYFTGFS